MWYLVIAFQIIIPEKYPTEIACETAARDLQHFCIKAPDTGNCQSTIPGTPYVITIPCNVSTGK